MLRLFEIPDAIRSALADPTVMDQETGELLQPEVLEAIEADKERLILWCARRVRELVAESDAVKMQATTLTARSNALRNRADSLKDRMAFTCQKGEKFSDDCVRVSIQESKSVAVLNEEAIPAKYKIQPPLPDLKLDKKEILKALKDGEEIKGAALQVKRFAKLT